MTRATPSRSARAGLECRARGATGLGRPWRRTLRVVEEIPDGGHGGHRLLFHSGFNQFAAFAQDAIDNRAFAATGKLTMPALAIGGEKSFGAGMGDILRFVATDVTSAVIRNSGHWLM